MDTAPDHEPADPRVDELRADISARLRGVCAHLSDKQFSALVDDIADVTLKYDDLGAITRRSRPKQSRAD